MRRNKASRSPAGVEVAVRKGLGSLRVATQDGKAQVNKS
jgi:hypothetical protein